MKVVIVGGVAGGATAAARIRRLDEQAQIVADNFCGDKRPGIDQKGKPVRHGQLIKILLHRRMQEDFWPDVHNGTE